MSSFCIISETRTACTVQGITGITNGFVLVVVRFVNFPVSVRFGFSNFGFGSVRFSNFLKISVSVRFGFQFFGSGSVRFRFSKKTSTFQTKFWHLMRKKMQRSKLKNEGNWYNL